MTVFYNDKKISLKWKNDKLSNLPIWTIEFIFLYVISRRFSIRQRHITSHSPYLLLLVRHHILKRAFCEEDYGGLSLQFHCSFSSEALHRSSSLLNSKTSLKVCIQHPTALPPPAGSLDGISGPADAVVYSTVRPCHQLQGREGVGGSPVESGSVYYGTIFMSLLIRDILLLCPGSILFGCLGLEPNTMALRHIDLINLLRG